MKSVFKLNQLEFKGYSNRLRFEEDLKKFPEILDQEIIAPIVIVGLPRTGSTMTHRLLASDPNHTAMLVVGRTISCLVTR